MALTSNRAVLAWIDEMAAMTQPDQLVWIDGSEAQLEELRKQACASGEIEKLNEEKLPGCYLHRTAVNDVARVEDRTFICCKKQEDAGPTNHWMDPQEMYAKLKKLYTGAMKGRTMYVIPYSMGVVGSPFAKYGIELTDSIYVVLNMAIMTRVGRAVADVMGDDFVKGLHAKADIAPENRYIVHFPEDNTIMSVNSGYGGNVLLGKKCFALRIASHLGRQQGWMAEHMLILGVENPQGEVRYLAAAFPSACGKTNLAMLIPPEHAVGWQGRPWNGKTSSEKGAHPNSRFTAPAKNCPCISPEFESPRGVPISAIVFGGRRARTAPLVYQSRDWTHGVFVGSIMASETTAAATGAVGVVRRDPMAMLPFCGYHMGDYWQHWLDMGEKLGDKAPKIFNVNWFRTDDDGNFLWPGFGDNLRVLEWILKRCFGEVEAVETPIGWEPRPEDIDLEDSGVELDTLRGLLGVDTALWRDEVKGIREFYQKFGDRLPRQLSEELDVLDARLN